MNWRTFRENVEALTVAVLLALVIRHFFVGSYEIPTGSMAAGLNGLHITVTCPNCTTANNVGVSSDSLTNRVQLSSKLEIYQGVCPKREIPIKIATNTLRFPKLVADGNVMPAAACCQARGGSPAMPVTWHLGIRTTAKKKVKGDQSLLFSQSQGPVLVKSPGSLGLGPTL